MSAPAITVAADLLSLREVGPWLHTWLRAAGEEVASLGAPMELGLQELCVNVVNHAYGEIDPGVDATIDLALERSEDGVTCVVRDRGNPAPVDLLDQADPTEAQVHGYGLMILRQLTETLRYERNGDENVWTLTFAVPAAV